MDTPDLVQVTAFFSDRRYRDGVRGVGQEVLGALPTPPAITVIVADIFDGACLLEIEAVAAH